MEQNSKITIGFELTDQWGQHYKAESYVELFDDYDELVAIYDKFNIFLNQAGFIRNRGGIFTKDVTIEEAEALEDFLEDYRKRESEINKDLGIINEC